MVLEQISFEKNLLFTHLEWFVACDSSGNF